MCDSAETLRTNVTWIGLFSSVNQCMSFEVYQMPVTLITVLTVIPPIFCVYTVMSSEIHSISESFITDVTYVRKITKMSDKTSLIIIRNKWQSNRRRVSICWHRIRIVTRFNTVTCHVSTLFAPMVHTSTHVLSWTQCIILIWIWICKDQWTGISKIN
jgi:hypothetical protein